MLRLKTRKSTGFGFGCGLLLAYLIMAGASLLITVSTVAIVVWVVVKILQSMGVL